MLACTACPYEATRRLIWISPLRFRHLVHCIGVNEVIHIAVQGAEDEHTALFTVSERTRGDFDVDATCC
jgi:hypothetical protein